MIEVKEILETAVKAADLKRAEDIVVLDVQTVSLLADYFIICQANSTRQVDAIVDEVIEKVEELGGTLRRIEGKETSQWVLIDFGDVIIHVFQASEREYYNLEKLWSDAPMVDITEMVAD